MSKLTASVVGGGAGGKLSMTALRDSDRFDLVAVADLKPEVCAALAVQYPGIRTFTSHEEMFAACPTDVVCVSTYPPTHEPVALDALRLSLKGILVEKPLGHTAASGRRTLNAIRRAGLPMAVPHGLLVGATPLEILSRVRRGEIGALKLVEIQNTRWDIINAGIHWLNYFVTLTGGEEMDSVMALCESSTRTYRDGMQVETTAVTYAQTKSGVRVVMNTGDEVRVNREGKNTLFRLVGDEGQIEFWGWENAYRLLNAEHPRGELFVPTPLPGTAHQRHLEHMADMIDRGEPDYTIPESSLLALEICEGAYLSSRHRCKVTFPVDQFTPPDAAQADAASAWDPGMPYSGQGGGRDGRKL
jgi:predicted dehydrogenase